MNTFEEKINSKLQFVEQMKDLLSKVDVACVFARSKSMKYLLDDIKLEEPFFKDMRVCLLIFGTIVAGVAAAANFGWLSVPQWYGIVMASLIAVPLSYYGIKSLSFRKHNERAKKAGMLIFANADQEASAVTKMRIIDACEAEGLSQPHLDALKGLANHSGIPQGWWKSAAQLIDGYQKSMCEITNKQQKNDQEHQAQQRLSSIPVMTETVQQQAQNDPKRFFV